MVSIEPVDQLDVLIVVDNVTDMLSSTPSFVESETTSLWRRGMKVLSGKCLCCAAHGFVLHHHGPRNGKEHTLLFDTGPDEWVFERNVNRLGADLGLIEGMVLSHGHWDHAGAMPRAARSDHAAKRRPGSADLHASGHVPHPCNEGS